MLHCTCCQAEITAPQWFNGKPYGYTCITKVSCQKRTKKTPVWAECEVEFVNNDGAGVKVHYQGRVLNLPGVKGVRMARCYDAPVNEVFSNGVDKVVGQRFKGAVMLYDENKAPLWGFLNK